MTTRHRQGAPRGVTPSLPAAAPTSDGLAASVAANRHLRESVNGLHPTYGAEGADAHLDQLEALYRERAVHVSEDLPFTRQPR